jgi:crotonobetainyl-CoA:carnitine CoA-transferase CaiB-like acyl-CoA transferase
VDQRPPVPAPQVGEHSLAILSELGLGEDELKILRDEGVISMP